LALDEPKETDDSFEIGGVTYIVDKEFLEKVTPVKIDYLETPAEGFLVTGNIDFIAACSSCNTESTCCS